MSDESTPQVPQPEPQQAAPAPVPPVPGAYAPPPAPPAPGAYAPPPGAYPTPGYAPAGQVGQKNRVTAGILAILLGSLGVHKFYMGYNGAGIILLLVTVLSFGMLSWIGAIIGLIEGILYLTKTDQEFYYTYEAAQKTWF